jgi:hypothetical protein
MNNDLEHLRLLSKGYYIYGILSAVFYLIPIIFVFVGIGIVNGKIRSEETEVIEMGSKLIIIGTIVFLYGQIASIATILVGKFIKNRTRHTFCLVVAGFNCMFFPIGTGLGIFTFIVLLRDSVKEVFKRTIS